MKERLSFEFLTQSGYVPIPSYPNYFINQSGQIYSLKQKKFIINFPDAGGYLSVTMNRKLTYVNRLVAQAFLPEFSNFRYVLLKDKNKTNIHLSNLQLSNTIGAGQQPKPIVLNGGVLREDFPSISEAARYLKTSQTNIRNHIKSGKLYKGNMIRYAL